MSQERQRSDHVVSQLLAPCDTSLLRDVFIRIDIDGDGLISTEDILAFVRCQQHSAVAGTGELTDTLTRSFVELADTDADGRLDIFDFLAAHVPGCPGVVPVSAVAHVAATIRNVLSDDDLDELQIAFRVFDVDGDGQLSEQELTALLRVEAALRNVQQRRRRHRARLTSGAGSSLAASASTVFGMAAASSSAAAGPTSSAVDEAAVAWILARAARGMIMNSSNNDRDGTDDHHGGAAQSFNLCSFIRVAQESEILLPHAAACNVPLAVKIKRCYDELESEQQEEVGEKEGEEDQTAPSDFVHLMKVAAGEHRPAEVYTSMSDEQAAAAAAGQEAEQERKEEEEEEDPQASRAARIEETAALLQEELLCDAGQAVSTTVTGDAISRLIAEALVREIELLREEWAESGISVLDGLMRNYATAPAAAEGGEHRHQNSSKVSAAVAAPSAPSAAADSSSSAWLSSMWVALRIFDLLDTRDRKALGPAELAFLASASESASSALELVALYDMDGDGVLSFAEFLAALSASPPLIPRDRVEACELYLGFLASSVQASALARVLVSFPTDPVAFADALDQHLDVVGGMGSLVLEEEEASAGNVMLSNGTNPLSVESVESDGGDDDVGPQKKGGASSPQQQQKQQQRSCQFERKQRLQRCYTRDTVLLLATEGCVEPQEQRLAIAAFQQLLRSDTTVLMQIATLLTSKTLLSVPNIVTQRRQTESASAFVRWQHSSPVVSTLPESGFAASALTALCPGSLLANIAVASRDASMTTMHSREDSLNAAADAGTSASGGSGRHPVPPPPSHTLSEAFSILDGSGSGALAPDIVVPIATKRLLGGGNRFDLRVVHRVVASLFRSMDRDYDDRLSLAELHTAVSGPLVLLSEYDLASAAAQWQQQISGNSSQHAAHHHHHAAATATGSGRSSRSPTSTTATTPEPRSLPQSDIAYINNLFHTIDTKRDGFIDSEELEAPGNVAAAALLGDARGTWDAEQRAAAAAKLLEEGDLDGDGVLSEAEFLSCFIRGLTHVPSSAKKTSHHHHHHRQEQEQRRSNSNINNSNSSRRRHSSKTKLSKRTSSPNMSTGEDSPEKIETLRYLFSYIDRNRNGLISKDELKLLLREFLDTHFQNDASRLSQFTDEMLHEISSGNFAEKKKDDGEEEEEEFTFDQFVAAFERNPDLMRISADAVRVRIQRTEEELQRLLREEDLRRIAKVFVSLDADGNGVLDFEEVHDELFDLIKAQYPEWTSVDVERTVRSIFETADINSDGELSFDEFMHTFVNKHYSLSGFIDARAARFRRDLTAEEVAELKSLFSFMDANDDGRVSAEELESLVSAALRETANDDPATIAAIVDSVLAIADTNRDGSVDLREFIAAYQQDSQLLDIPIMAAAARRDAAEKKMQEMLCKHDLRDIAKVFLMIDKNGDGEISKLELEEEIAAQLHRLHPTWREERVTDAINTVFDAADWSPHSGTLSLDAFIESFVQGHYLLPPGAVQDVVATFTRKLSSEEVGQLVALFNKIDENADGTISKQELERALGEAVGKDTAEAVSKVVMTVADENFDGVLSISEFLKCYQLDNGLLTVPLSGMSVTTLGHVAERIIPKQGLRRLGRMFHLLDTDNDGFLTPQELAAGIRKYSSSSATTKNTMKKQSSFEESSTPPPPEEQPPPPQQQQQQQQQEDKKNIDDVARAKVLSADLDGDGKLSLDEWMASYANAGCDAALILPWAVIDAECASPLAGTPTQIKSPRATDLQQGGNPPPTAPPAARRSLVGAAGGTRRKQDEEEESLCKDAEKKPASVAEFLPSTLPEVAPPPQQQQQPPQQQRPASAPKHPTPPATEVAAAAAPPQSGRARRFQAAPRALSTSSSPTKVAIALTSTDQDEMRRLFDSLGPADDGTIEVSKAKTLFREMESFGLPPSERQIEMVFGRAVKRTDGRMSFNTFAIIFLKRFTL